MKLKFTIPIVVLFFFIATSCDQLVNTLDNIDELSKEEVIGGLKTALNVGTDTTVFTLNQTDGYFKDLLIKILLPEDAQNVLNLAMSSQYVQAIGLDELLKTQIDEVVLRMNRTAEDAAAEAKPIFRDAIVNLSLDQAWDILNGSNPLDTLNKKKSVEFDSSAATHYLQAATFSQLQTLYEPKIDAALSKGLVANVSTNQAWEKLTDLYNPVASLLGAKELDPSLTKYVTEKALNGLFLKIAGIEKDIRRDPAAWALQTAQDILEKVFGSTQTNGK